MASTLVAERFRVEAIEDLVSLGRLMPAWSELLDKAGVDHPFLTPEWFVAWWEAFGQESALRILTVHDGADLVAVLPLMLLRDRLYGLPVRRLRSIGNWYTPRFDVLLAPRSRATAMTALWQGVVTRCGAWDVLQLDLVPDDSPLLESFEGLARARALPVGRTRGAHSPWVPLTGTWTSYLGTLPAKHRANLRNRWRRLAAQGPVKLEAVGEGALAEVLAEGYRLEAAAWKGVAGTAIEALPDARRFFSRLAELAAHRGWLRLQFLRVGDRRIAFHYALEYAGKLFLLKPGYDPAFAHYSPCNLLVALVLEESFARGLTSYEFLGEADPWKLRWTSALRPHTWLFVFSPGLRGRLLHRIKFGLVPWLRPRLADPRLRPLLKLLPGPWKQVARVPRVAHGEAD
jgi:CelD/BcsL family acetyltransferase involved in cellulose biosynthesis